MTDAGIVRAHHLLPLPLHRAGHLRFPLPPVVTVPPAPPCGNLPAASLTCSGVCRASFAEVLPTKRAEQPECQRAFYRCDVTGNQDAAQHCSALPHPHARHFLHCLLYAQVQEQPLPRRKGEKFVGFTFKDKGHTKQVMLLATDLYSPEHLDVPQRNTTNPLNTLQEGW